MAEARALFEKAERETDPSRWAVNVRCLDGVDLSSLKVLQFDGQHWEGAAKAFRESRARGATKLER